MSDTPNTPEDPAVVGRPSPADDAQARPVPAFGPRPAPEADDDEDQADEAAPAPHAASKGYGVTGKFATTSRGDE